MKVSLNPINTNTKSNNFNQVDFKARAELRLSEEFFAKLASLKPEEAANRAQGILDVMAVLRRAKNVGRKKDVMVLKDYDSPKGIPDYIEQLQVVYFEHSKRLEGKDFYDEKRIKLFDVLSDGCCEHIRGILNKFLSSSKKRQIPESRTKFFYHKFAASEDGSDTLSRKKVTYAGFSPAELCKPGTSPRVLRTETTTLAELMQKLRALCTSPKKQVHLEKDNVLPATLLKIEERSLEWNGKRVLR